MAYTPVSDDYFVAGGTARSALNDNVLAASGSAAIDTLAIGNGLSSAHSMYIQIIGSAGISAGAVTFEGSNDNATFVTIALYDEAVSTGAVTTNATVAASASRWFAGPVTYRYIRVRISTAFVGGTISAIARFSTAPYVPRVTQVAQPTPSNLQVTTVPTTGGSYNVVSAASTNAASVKSSAGNLYEITVSNPTATPIYVKLYNKASAPTVGTDVPVLTIPVAAGATVALQFGSSGKRFTTGIAIAATAAAAATDTAAAVAGVQINASYN